MQKIIFITGTSSGFGKLTAITLSKAGHIVIAGMRGTKEKNKAVAEELSNLPNIETVEIDVTDDISVSSVFKQVLDKFGKIDVLVNNAGISGYGLLEAYSIEQIKKIFEVNFYGIIRTYQAVLPSMRQAKKGLIINLTSGASGHALPFMGAYLASKFSVEAITEAIQDELKPFNIENVTIQPGPYPTEMNTGAKIGVNSDKPEISQTYEPFASEMFNTMLGGMVKKMEEFQMNPQIVANGILELINMADGSRPLRFPLDAIAQGTDKEFIKARAAIKAKWLANYMQ
ncbi:SDR family oxidoreductase [Marinilongibacter aquaticus]|uniref:SDR family oxidoreductase n=1 Tax=Marinilongibacter aquaticus TaxID=2975157 RepID=UPI0021BD0303|nr:SDR family oxidoreductase [Marinilongibacter aquaticus]UBM59579.1 SDR family oxidoreductase [Marinilongibacter aquaticus]